MTNLLFWKLHALLAHIAAILIITSTVFFMVDYLRKKHSEQMGGVAKWLLWAGVLAGISGACFWLIGPSELQGVSNTHAQISSYIGTATFALVAAVVFAFLFPHGKKVSVQQAASSFFVGALVIVASIEGFGLFYGGTPFFPSNNETLKDTSSGMNSTSSSDSVKEFVVQFQTALHSDRFLEVSNAFDRQAIIFENGAKEPSLDVYLNDHLKPEMAMLKAARRTVLSQEITEHGAIASVATRSLLSFSVKGEQKQFDSTETLVLFRSDSSWKIVHAHWSSRPHRN
ncbi:nuclear transport factor 2 family protein [Kordiimonas laminariae]|uniref:nuclear transport factor 2 family protein n=1 Tax=Kordiimonas laminariae TaxID=2917717 RepID=UPI001FF2DB22|nr:nuclear transport factor 2 family protein [Kordiimonas laminariae]MCK0071112.1 nuclear transport factor 2 family protein [Kordiimonas laminariae]